MKPCLLFKRLNISLFSRYRIHEKNTESKNLRLFTFGLPACNKQSSEYYRVSKDNNLSFNPTTNNDNQKIQSLVQQGGYTHRVSEWQDKWNVAHDKNHLIYRGGVAKSDSNYVTFVVVWSNSQRRVVFSEIGHKRTGTYPSGLESSP